MDHPADSVAFEPAPGAHYEAPRDASSHAHSFEHWHRLIDALPRLGSVLWLHPSRSDRVFPRARLLPRGVLLFDHPALAPLVHATQLAARARVTRRGPREAIDFIDASDQPCAQLALLPDTDYLAWDRLLEDCALGSDRAPCRGSAMPHAITRDWRARAVRFAALRLPALQLLGLRPAQPLSPLGAKVARQIGDEMGVRG